MFASHADDRGSIPGRDRYLSLKQVVTAQLSNALQELCVSHVLGYYQYKQLARVTFEYSMFNGHMCIGQHLYPFDVMVRSPYN